jgi:selenophosphate synthase
MYIFERKVYKRILGPVYDNEKENWMILTNKAIYAIVKQLTITEEIRLIDYTGFGMYREWKKIEFPKEYYL